MESRCTMVAEKIKMSLLVLMCFSLVQNISFGAGAESSEAEKQEYKQERARIKALRKSFKPGPINDLKEYEKFGDEIQMRWKNRNKEHYGRLMLEVCKPLSSGRLKGDRRYEVARKYALSALADANDPPLEIELELELTGHVVTLMYTPNSPKGEDFAQRRKKDVQIRLHAWKRLIDAIDPNWDPNDKPVRNVVPPTETGLPSGVTPEAIKDSKLRAEYIQAIDKNRKKAEKYLKQSKLLDWLKRYPKSVERDIVLAYSEPPFKLEELRQHLDNYIADEKTKARIVSAVKKNVEKKTQKMPK